MKELGGYLLTLILSFSLGVLVSVDAKYDDGAKDLHKGTISCQTMPDNNIYCWKTKKENKE